MTSPDYLSTVLRETWQNLADLRQALSRLAKDLESTTEIEE